MKFASLVAVALLTLIARPVYSQTTDTNPSVIDIHMHALMNPGSISEKTSLLDSNIRDLDSLNVR